MTGEPLGHLHGVPFSVKDLVFTRRVLTTAGSRLFADHVPEEDAVVVERLKGAGAILVGKTNTPEFGHKGVTDNPLFGITRNPWNPELTPGGSSGGAGAAVAAGLGPLAVGTDGGGSIRIPGLVLRNLRTQAVLRPRAVVPEVPGLARRERHRTDDADGARRGAHAGRDGGPG